MSDPNQASSVLDGYLAEMGQEAGLRAGGIYPVNYAQSSDDEFAGVGNNSRYVPMKGPGSKRPNWECRAETGVSTEGNWEMGEKDKRARKLPRRWRISLEH